MDPIFIILAVPAGLLLLNFLFSYYEYSVSPAPASGETRQGERVYVLTMKDYRELRRAVERVCILALASLATLHLVAGSNIFSGITVLTLLIIFSLLGLYIVLYIRSTAVEFYS